MICNFMIFLEYVGSRACLSAKSSMSNIVELFFLCSERAGFFYGFDCKQNSALCCGTLVYVVLYTNITISYKHTFVLIIITKQKAIFATR